MPDREELGDLDKTQWEAGPDKTPRDPWRNTRFVYLVDPHSAEALTYSTSSWGGREAVINLGDAIAAPGAPQRHADRSARSCADDHAIRAQVEARLQGHRLESDGQ